MAVTAIPYANFALGLGVGAFNLTSDTLKVLLTTSAYTPSVANHVYVGVVTNQVSGTGYTSGGATLSNVTWTYDAGNARAVLGADPVTWTGADFTARFAVVYKDTGNLNTSRLIGFIDFGVDKTYASEDAQLNFPSGVVRVKLG